MGGNCLEARHTDTYVEVRDSKDRAGRALRFTPTAWTAFVNDIAARDLGRS
jgi:hypothetical protein